MKTFTQKEIFDYLSANPLNVKVHIGDLEEMNNEDYIFFDRLTESIIGSDNEGAYSTDLQFSVVVKDYDTRTALVRYIKNEFVCSIGYEYSKEHEYFVARMRTSVILYD